MFKNSGKKIMGFVNFVFYLNLVLAVLALGAVTVFAFIELTTEEALLILGLGLVCVLVYMLLVFLSLLTLYAFGELVQSSIETRRILAQMQLENARHIPGVPDQQPVRTGRKGKEKAAPAPVPAPVPAPTPVVDPLDDEFSIPVSPIQQPAAAETPERAVNLAYDYKAAAGAPAFPVNNVPVQEFTVTEPLRPGLIICSKCGAKHEPTATTCRYCGNTLQ